MESENFDALDTPADYPLNHAAEWWLLAFLSPLFFGGKPLVEIRRGKIRRWEKKVCVNGLKKAC